MKKMITATKENRRFLAKKFNVTERMVYKALSGGSDSELARKIRHTALQRGAQEVEMYDEFETWYDYDGYIRQYFQNGAMLEIKKGTDEGIVFLKGRTLQRISGINFKNIGEVQREIIAMQ